MKTKSTPDKQAGTETLRKNIPAYSYIRFSGKEQEKGDSVRRQKEMRQRFLDAHPELALQKTTFEDLGVSGWTGANLAAQFGMFLEQIQSGKVRKPSVLLVEAIDRITRQEPWEAFDPIRKVINAGVSIITLEDGERYTRAKLNRDAHLVSKLISRLDLASDESRRKSRRIGTTKKNSKENARLRAREGKPLPLTKQTPHWLQVRGEKGDRHFVIIPERAAIVKEIFEMRAGVNGYTEHGWYRIAAELNRRWKQGEKKTLTAEDGKPILVAYEPWGEPKRTKDGHKNEQSKWHPSYIQKLLTNTALLGDYQPRKTRKEHDDYFRVDDELYQDEEEEAEELLPSGRRKPQNDGEVIRFHYPILPAFGADKKWLNEFQTNPDARPSLWLKAAGVKLLDSGRTGVKRSDGESTLTNLFSGLVYHWGLAEDTGTRMTLINKGKKKRVDGSYGEKVWQYLAPAGNERLGRNSYWEYDHVENLFLDYINNIDWQRLASTQQKQKNTALGKRLDTLREEVKALQGDLTRLDKLQRAAESDAAIRHLAKQFDKAATSVEAKQKELQRAEAERAAEHKPLIAKTDLNTLRNRAKTDVEARRKLRSEIRRRIKRLCLYPHPTTPSFVVIFNTEPPMYQEVEVDENGQIQNIGRYHKSIPQKEAAKFLRGQPHKLTWKSVV